MTDDERIQALQAALVDAVNAATLPLSVKALALENLLLRVKVAMQSTYSENNAGGESNGQSIEDANGEGNAQNAAEVT